MENPDKFITNLSGYELPWKEVEILKLDLRHSLASRPVESEIIVISEDIWDKIKNAKVIENDSSEQRIKTALCAFTFNYIDEDEKQFGTDGKDWRYLKSWGRK